jgi:hypothetical protein
MITEREFLTSIAEIILSVFNNPEMCLTKTAVCSDGHFSPKMLYPERLLCMRSDTLMRLLLYLATTMNDLELYDLFARLYQYIAYVANHDEHSAYDIIDSHAGSPINRKPLIEFV